MPRKSHRSQRRSRSRSVSKKKRSCNTFLSYKVGKNLDEFKKKKRYRSKSQAIAVSYSQLFKYKPECEKLYPAVGSRKARKSRRRSRR